MNLSPTVDYLTLLGIVSWLAFMAIAWKFSLRSNGLMFAMLLAVFSPVLFLMLCNVLAGAQ